MTNQTKTTEVLGYPVRFRRRRYSNQTFCWAECFADHAWHDLGDPWMGVNWSQDALHQAVKYLVQEVLAIESCDGHHNGQHIGMFL